MTLAPIQVAVLDDYQKVAASIFSRLQTSGFEVTTFSDTLPPYNHPATTQDDKAKLINRLKPFSVICTMRERTPFPKELIAELPNLQLLLTTGFRNAAIDLEACKSRGIPVAGSTGHGRSTNNSKRPHEPNSTTQHTIALILGIARNIALDDAVVKSGGWQTSFAVGLQGKTLALLGLGKLGAATARIMYQSFAMRIIAWSPNLTQEAADQKAQELGLPVEDEDGEKTFLVVSKDAVFREADIVSVHLVLSARSKGIVQAEDLAKMKKSALLANTSRGPLIDEQALLDTLKRGAIRGAALDVFDLEPLPADSEWRSTGWGTNGTSQVLLSPHMGYGEEQIMIDWYHENVENIERWYKKEELSAPFY